MADPALTPTAAMLLDAVHRHYPSGLWTDDPTHAAAPETARLRAAQACAQTDRSRVVAVMEAIEADAPGVRSLDASYLAYDAGYTIRLNADPVTAGTRRWREVVACISVIAPVFLCHQVTIAVDAARLYHSAVTDSPDPSVEPLWRTTARCIEAVFAHAPIDAKLASLVVRDVQVQNIALGEATLRDALFSPART